MKRKLKFHLTSYRAMRELLLCVAVCLLPLLHRSSADAPLNYTEVDRLGNACPRLDSCAHLRSSGRRQLTYAGERNCECDHLCSQYGDCCIDAPGNDPDGRRLDVHCLELKQFGGVYMKDSCPSTFRGPEETRRLCQETRPGDPSDPLGSMPVTDALSGLTYKNHHCALCDDDRIEGRDLVVWTPRLECPLLALLNDSSDGRLTDEYVLRNLATDGRAWGLYLDGEKGNGSSRFFHECDVDPVMPRELEPQIRLCRPRLVSECDPQWQPGNDRTRALCHAYAGARYVHGGHGYKNVHCAMCNGANVTRLSCQSAEMRGIDIFRQFGTHSFALLLDINEGRGPEVGRVRACPQEGDVFDPFFKRCRSLACLPGYVRRGRGCIPRSTEAPPVIEKEEFAGNGTVNATHDIQQQTADAQTIVDLNLSSGKFLNVSSDDFLLDCLLISLSPEDYVMLPNRTVFVPRYDRSYGPASYYHHDARDGRVLVCAPFSAGRDHVAKFPSALGYVTVAGLGISMLCLALHLGAFCAVPDLRNLSGRNLASQCVALFCAHLCFLAGQFESLSATLWCAPAALLTFYFFQASFSWMAVMAYDVWRTLRVATTELRVSNGRQRGRFCAYSLFAWATPLLALALLALAEYTELFPPAYRPDFGSGRPPCWFKRRRSLLVFFATPLFAVMLANVILFAASARMIVMTTGQTSASSRSQPRRNFRLYLRLALLMGLTWAVGLVAGSADLPFLFYAFVALNSLQGLFIFVAFSCNSKVLGHLKGKLLSRSMRRKEFKSSGNSTGSAFSTKPTTFMIRN